MSATMTKREARAIAATAEHLYVTAPQYPIEVVRALQRSWWRDLAIRSAAALRRHKPEGFNMTVKPTTPEGNAAYRKGLCIDCLVAPYSAGRPRCERCHQIWSDTLTVPPPGSLSVDDIYSKTICTGPVCQRDTTSQFRARHDTGLCEWCTAHEKAYSREELR